MSGKLENNGHDVRLRLDEPFPPTQHYVNISAGPLSYQYRVSEIILHYGVTNVTGSEHTINGVSFPAEVNPLPVPCIARCVGFFYFKISMQRCRIEHCRRLACVDRKELQ